MDHKDYLQKTRKLAKLTRVLCRITVWAAAIGAAILAVTVLVAYVVSPEHIKPLQDSSKLSLFLPSDFTLPADVFISVDALRSFLGGLLAKVAVGVGVYIVAAVHVMGLLKSVEIGEPFAADNVKRLRKIGLILIVGSVVIPSVSAIAANMMAFSSLLEVKGNSMFDATLLLCGFLVIILSGVFAYGARLQREHDQTV